MTKLLTGTVVLLTTATFFETESETENFEIYDNRSVSESVDSFTDERTFALRCAQESDDRDPMAEEAYIILYTRTEQPGKSGMIAFSTGKT